MDHVDPEILRSINSNIAALCWCVTMTGITLAVAIVSAANTIKTALLRHSLTPRR